jgi:hypothetical protein
VKLEASAKDLLSKVKFSTEELKDIVNELQLLDREL